MSGRLKWYAARLATMSPAEVLHRVKELAVKRRLGRLSDGWRRFGQDAFAELADLKDMRARLARSACVTVDETLTGARFLGMVPDLASYCDGIPRAGFWHRDPISGLSWPGREADAFALDVRSTSATPGGERRFGDVKFVWEPNRLQILQPLAAIIAAGGTQASRASQTAFEILQSWMDANPPYRGVNWTSGIELSMRLLSVFLLAAAHEPALLGQAQRTSIAKFVEAHARWLAALPSLHSSANNHRVAEGAGLYLAGVLAPHFERRSGYATHGRSILEREALLQIFEDGVGGEQSPTYQAFTMELLAFAALVGEGLGAAFSMPVLERLEAGARFLAELQFGDGDVPAIGDDDEGRALQWPAADEPLYVASVTACVDSLRARPSRVAAGYFRESLFFGVSAPRPAQAPLPVLSVFDKGGYSIVRDRICERDVHLVFDHGPLGYLSLAAHGHADALALWLAVDGVPVFIDAGTWLYHSGQAQRARLRQSQSHNTLCLPGMSQSEPSSAFSWANKAQAKRVEPDTMLGGGKPTWAFAGSHDGYVGRTGLLHRRDILGFSDRIAIADRLVDRLAGQNAARSVEIAFLCHPEIEIRAVEDAIELSRAIPGLADLRLWLRPPAGFSARVERGGDDAQYAFHAPRFGQLRPTARILLSGQTGPQPCLTALEFAAR